MKKYFKSVLLIALTLALGSNSCSIERVEPSGNVISIEKSITGYNAIDVSNSFKVNVRFSDTEESIVLSVDDNLVDLVKVENDNGTLEIVAKNNLNISGNATLKVDIVTKNISSFNASGASAIILENGTSGNNLNFDVSGASEITLKDAISVSNAKLELSGASVFNGKLIADKLAVDMSGASKMNMDGKAGVANFEVSGASTANSFGLEIDKLTAELSGASTVRANVNQGIEIDASGASSLVYTGTAQVLRQDVSGASTVRKK